MTKKSSLKVLCVFALALVLVFALSATALAADVEVSKKVGETVKLEATGLTPGGTYTWKAAVGYLGFSGSQDVTVGTDGKATLTFTAALPTGVSAKLADTITLTASSATKPADSFKVVVTPVPTLGTLKVTVGTITTTYTELPTKLNFIQGDVVTFELNGAFTTIDTKVTTNLGNTAILAEKAVVFTGAKSNALTLSTVGVSTLFLQPAIDTELMDDNENSIYTGGDVKAIEITVATSVPPTAVALADATVAVGKNITLVPAFTPANANQLSGVAWTTSDDSIAIVTSNGMVYGLKVGEVTITYTVNSLKATCKVTVTATGAVDPVDPVDPPDTGDAFPIWIALLGVAAIAAGTFAVKKVRA